MGINLASTEISVLNSCQYESALVNLKTGDFNFKNYALLPPSYYSSFWFLVWEKANCKDLTTARHRLACRPLLGTFPESCGIACCC